ncbi:MAG TPA: hypothetical protein VF493_17415, partial [Terriglobales bacterium]
MTILTVVISGLLLVPAVGFGAQDSQTGSNSTSSSQSQSQAQQTQQNQQKKPDQPPPAAGGPQGDIGPIAVPKK